MRILLAAIGGLVLFSACAGDGEQQTAPTLTPTVHVGAVTPQPTPTPDVTACPVDPATCAAAKPFIDAWKAKDLDALVSLSAPLETKCPVPRPQGLGGPYPLCEDATIDGELRYGYVWSSGSHGGLAGADRLRSDLQRATASAKPLLSIGCAVGVGTNRCEGAFSLVFGPYAYGGELEQVAELSVIRDPGATGLIGVLPVFVSRCDGNVTGSNCALVNGGVTDGRGYSYWGDEAQLPRSLPAWTFFRWTP